MAGNYLAGTCVTDEQIEQWVAQFHRDGYLFLPSILPPDWMEELRSDLDRELKANDEEGDGVIQLHHRMFETSRANLRSFVEMPNCGSVADFKADQGSTKVRLPASIPRTNRHVYNRYRPTDLASSSPRWSA